MKKLILLILYLLFHLFCISTAQQTGKFEVDIDPGIANYYVPESYNHENQYPLIIAMPLGGMSGFDFRDRIIPPVTEINAILICPDDGQWSLSLIKRAISHAKNNYNIDSDKLVLTGHSVGGGFVFQYGIANSQDIAGIIGIAPSLYKLNFTESFICTKPISLIVGSIDYFKVDCDMLYDYYQQINGKCNYIIKDGVDHEGPYFLSDEFKNDWIDCYNFIIGNTPNDVQNDITDNDFNIFPNPIFENGRIDLILKDRAFLELSICNILGQEVKVIYKDYLSSDTYSFKVNVEDINSGMYFLKLVVNNKVIAKQIAIKK